VLRQPGYPNFFGPAAFRPTITRGLALSAMLVLIFLNITKAISMPKGIGGSNPLIFKDLYEN
jgi:hypothetical protein